MATIAQVILVNVKLALLRDTAVTTMPAIVMPRLPNAKTVANKYATKRKNFAKG